MRHKVGLIGCVLFITKRVKKRFDHYKKKAARGLANSLHQHFLLRLQEGIFQGLTGKPF